MEEQREFIDLDEATKLAGLSKMTVWRIFNSIYTSDNQDDKKDVVKIDADNPKGFKLVIARDRLEKELEKKQQRQQEREQQFIKSDPPDIITGKRTIKGITGSSDKKIKTIEIAVNTLITQNQTLLKMIQGQLEQKDRRISELEQSFLQIQNNFIQMLPKPKREYTSKERPIETEGEIEELEPIITPAPREQPGIELRSQSEPQQGQGSQPQPQQPPQQPRPIQTQTKKKGFMERFFG